MHRQEKACALLPGDMLQWSGRYCPCVSPRMSGCTDQATGRRPVAEAIPRYRYSHFANAPVEPVEHGHEAAMLARRNWGRLTGVNCLSRSAAAIPRSAPCGDSIDQADGLVHGSRGRFSALPFSRAGEANLWDGARRGGGKRGTRGRATYSESPHLSVLP
jgi:hypothetical protein